MEITIRHEFNGNAVRAVIRNGRLVEFDCYRGGHKVCLDVQVISFLLENWKDLQQFFDTLIAELSNATP